MCEICPESRQSAETPEKTVISVLVSAQLLYNLPERLSGKTLDTFPEELKFKPGLGQVTKKVTYLFFFFSFSGRLFFTSYKSSLRLAKKFIVHVWHLVIFFQKNELATAKGKLRKYLKMVINQELIV